MLLALAWYTVPQHSRDDVTRAYHGYFSGPAQLQDVRFQAHQALDGLNEDARRRGREGLIQLLRSSNDYGLRLSICGELGLLGTDLEPYLPELDRLLHVEPNPIVRERLVHLLADVRRQLAFERERMRSEEGRVTPVMLPVTITWTQSCIPQSFQDELVRAWRGYFRERAERDTLIFWMRKAENGPDPESRRRGREGLIRLFRSSFHWQTRMHITQVFVRLQRAAEPHLTQLENCLRAENDPVVRQDLASKLTYLRGQIRLARSAEQALPLPPRAHGG